MEELGLDLGKIRRQCYDGAGMYAVGYNFAIHTSRHPKTISIIMGSQV